LTTQILGQGRTALNLAGNLRAAAQARTADDGAINEAIYHLLSSGADHWGADGSPHVIGSGAVTITERVNSLSGMINPNLASTALLTGLFQALDETSAQAQQLANAIVAWRSAPQTKQDGQALLASYQRAHLPYGPPGQDFADVSELANVMGMTPALLNSALPHLSLYQTGDPDPSVADPVVRQALKLSGQAGSSSDAYNGNAPVVSVVAELAGPGGLDVRRIAVVSVAGTNGAEPFQMLSLGDDPQ
jgi:general secretion pathway protein K